MRSLFNVLLLALMLTSVASRRSSKKHHTRSDNGTVDQSQKRVLTLPLVIGFSSLSTGWINRGFASLAGAGAAIVRGYVESLVLELAALKTSMAANFAWTNQIQLYARSIQRCSTFVQMMDDTLTKKDSNNKPTNAAKIDAAAILSREDDGAYHILNTMHQMILGGTAFESTSIIEVYARKLDQKTPDFVLQVAEFASYIFKLQHGCYHAWKTANDIVKVPKYEIQDKYDENTAAQTTAVEAIFAAMEPYYWDPTSDYGSLTGEAADNLVFHGDPTTNTKQHLCSMEHNYKQYAGFVSDNKCHIAHDICTWSVCYKMASMFKVLYNRCEPGNIVIFHGESSERAIIADEHSKPCLTTKLNSQTMASGTTFEGKCIYPREGRRSWKTEGNPTFYTLGVDCNIQEIYEKKHGALPPPLE